MTYTWGWRGRHIFVMPDLGVVVTTTPIALMVPLPGQVFDGYNGHDPTYEELDGHQVAQGEQKGGYHEFFRILMRSVADQKIGDPGAWDQPADNSFNPDLFFGAPDKTVSESEPGNTEYKGWEWMATVPGAYAKALTTK